MATATDAELILKLYDLRREEVMREARKFMGGFSPKTLEDLFAVTRAGATQENAYWRQVTSFWDMAAALVLHGTIDADLFLDTNGEPFFLLAKVDHLRTEYQEKTGQVLMRRVVELIEKYPKAKQRYEGIVKMMQARG
jgi:hypothetical protein